MVSDKRGRALLVPHLSHLLVFYFCILIRRLHTHSCIDHPLILVLRLNEAKWVIILVCIKLFDNAKQLKIFLDAFDCFMSRFLYAWRFSLEFALSILVIWLFLRLSPFASGVALTVYSSMRRILQRLIDSSCWAKILAFRKQFALIKLLVGDTLLLPLLGIEPLRLLHLHSEWEGSTFIKAIRVDTNRSLA